VYFRENPTGLEPKNVNLHLIAIFDFYNFLSLWPLEIT
jgi:hypothetical protein